MCITHSWSVVLQQVKWFKLNMTLHNLSTDSFFTAANPLELSYGLILKEEMYYNYYISHHYKYSAGFLKETTSK